MCRRTLLFCFLFIFSFVSSSSVVGWGGGPGWARLLESETENLQIAKIQTWQTAKVDTWYHAQISQRQQKKGRTTNVVSVCSQYQSRSKKGGASHLGTECDGRSSLRRRTRIHAGQLFESYSVEETVGGHVAGPRAQGFLTPQPLRVFNSTHTKARDTDRAGRQKSDWFVE